MIPAGMPILEIIVAAPFVAALVIMVLPEARLSAIRGTAAVGAIISLLGAIAVAGEIIVGDQVNVAFLHHR